MIKLESAELELLLMIIGAGQYKGVDVPVVAKLIVKLQKEHEKVAPKIEGQTIKG